MHTHKQKKEKEKKEKEKEKEKEKKQEQKKKENHHHQRWTTRRKRRRDGPARCDAPTHSHGRCGSVQQWAERRDAHSRPVQGDHTQSTWERRDTRAAVDCW
jgi:hypothetical protein